MKDQKRNSIIMISILTVLLVGLVLILFFKSPNTTKENNNPEPTQYVASNRYKLPNNMSYEFNEQDKTIVLYGDNLENPSKNTKYLQYQIMLKDTGEIIYKSDILKPGDHLENITFPFDKAPGEYKIFLVSATIVGNGSEEENAIMTPLNISIK